MNGTCERQSFDDRRDIIIVGDREKTIAYSAEHFIETANTAIEDHGFFSAALSGGSTPKGIFNRLSAPENRQRVQWDKVLLFWSDERAVPPEHPDSNYHMAMEAGLATLKIPKDHIFRMVAEEEIENNAAAYEKIIREKVPMASFDLIMLGMGDDGHTASLFPRTHGLYAQEKLVTANFVPAHNAWRMTLTFDCINAAKNIAIYVIGKGKSKTLQAVLMGPYTPDDLPIQKVGTPEHPVFWIVDRDAAMDL